MRILQESPLSQADFLITVEGLPPEIYFHTCSEIKKEFLRPEHVDGRSARKRRSKYGSSQIADVTIGKAFDPDKDDAIVAFLREREDGEHFSIQVKPVRRSKEILPAGSRVIQLVNCRLLSYTVPNQVDLATGDSLVMLEFTVSVEDVSYSPDR